MKPELLEELLGRVARAELSVAGALDALRNVPVGDLGFARVDHSRPLRLGAPEVIYGAGKGADQIVGIARSLLEAGANVLCTRIEAPVYEAVRRELDEPRTKYHQRARCFTVELEPAAPVGRVGVLCAGTSDLPVAEEAAVAASFFGAEVRPYNDVGVAGLHRLLALGEQLTQEDVLVVVAGMDAALPSVVAGLLPQPVVAVPTSVGYGASFGGVAALLGALNSCSAGVTVVNIDNGFGAAAAAHRILRRRSSR